MKYHDESSSGGSERAVPVRLRNFGAGYGARSVLRGLDLSFPAFRTSVVIGPGGSGKSTLLRALSPSCPRGNDFWVRGEVEGLEVPSGHLLQSLGSAAMTLAELVSPTSDKPPKGLLLNNGAWEQADSLQRVDSARDLTVDLARARIHRVWGSNPGLVQQLFQALGSLVGDLPKWLVRLGAITAIFDCGYPLLLLDEPEVGLPAGIHDCLLKKLVETSGSATIVLVTHHLKVARAVGDFCVLLESGSVVEAGYTPQFFEKPTLARTRQFIELGG